MRGGQGLHHRQLPHQVRFGSPLSWYLNDLFTSVKLAVKCKRLSIQANRHSQMGYLLAEASRKSRPSKRTHWCECDGTSGTSEERSTRAPETTGLLPIPVDPYIPSA